MSVLSLTFHSTENISNDWNLYMENNLLEMIENLIDVEKLNHKDSIILIKKSDLIEINKNILMIS